MSNNRLLEFYTDGSYSSKSEIGAWAAICLEDNSIIDTQKGLEPFSSNNRMELLAILSALENANTIETKNTKVVIYTDSAYAANCFNQKWYLNWINNGWKTADRQDIKNQDLWRRIISLYIKLSVKLGLTIQKVPGHQGVKWNEYVDLLAQSTRMKAEKVDKEGGK